MTLDLASDAALFLGDFGESIVYKPRPTQAVPSPAPRTITAIVDREPPAFLLEANGLAVPTVHIIVRNSATMGISSDEIDTGGDQVDVALRLGQAATTKRIVRIVQQDAGILRLEVRECLISSSRLMRQNWTNSSGSLPASRRVCRA